MTEHPTRGTVTRVLGRTRRGGDGFVSCDCGRRHWGRYGAAGLLVLRDTDVLLQHRARWSHEGGTWAVPGGALDEDETPLQGALREAAEEAGIGAGSVRPRHSWTVDHGTWAYTTVVTDAVAAITPQRLDGESEELRWVPVGDIASMPLHSGFAAAWPSVAPLLARQETVVVDAANVVGSTPDGWWKDRVGAARRLLDGITILAQDGLPGVGSLLPEVVGRTRAWPDWVVVLEGQARSAAPVRGTREGASGAVEVIAAPGAGDDAIVTAVDARRSDHGDVTVVTADRGLRERVTTLGARAVGPRAVTSLL